MTGWRRMGRVDLRPWESFYARRSGDAAGPLARVVNGRKALWARLPSDSQRGRGLTMANSWLLWCFCRLEVELSLSTPNKGTDGTIL